MRTRVLKAAQDEWLEAMLVTDVGFVRTAAAGTTRTRRGRRDGFVV